MRIKILVTSLLFLFVGTLCAQDYVRITNRVIQPDGNIYGIHIENETIDAGAIKPNWWSAQWVFEKVPGTSKSFTIRNRWKKNGRDYYYLQIKNGKLVAGKLKKPNSMLAQWTVRKVYGTSSYYTIRNRWRRDSYLRYWSYREVPLAAGFVRPDSKDVHWKLEGFNQDLTTVAPKKKKKKARVKTKRKKKKSSLVANKKRKRKVRVRIKKLVCEMSDDEGPGNDADMSHFSFYLKFIKGSCGGKKLKTENYKLYIWNGDMEVEAGDQILIPNGKGVQDIFLESECELSNFRIRINGYATEKDSSSADEKASNFIDLSNNRSFGNHSFRLVSSDFSYRVELSVDKVGW